MFNSIPTVVKNIIIVNVLMFFAANVLPESFTNAMEGHFFGSTEFRPWQIVTHMFMHADLTHIFFNMYAFFIFGSALENSWGPKRFFTYYMFTGIGAFFLHQGVNYLEIRNLIASMPEDHVREVIANGASVLREGKFYDNIAADKLNYAYNIGMVGASGAVFGVLLAFGLQFPNTQLMLLFPPIPIKARYFVMIYGAIEVLLAMRNAPDDNVAHYAHLGGMLFGYILLKYWQSRDVRTY